MKTKDFEQAIAGINAEILRFIYNSNREVASCYGQLNLTYIMWDANGRAYIYNILEGQEDCVSEYNLAYLPYERDPKFDIIL